MLNILREENFVFQFLFYAVWLQRWLNCTKRHDDSRFVSNFTGFNLYLLLFTNKIVCHKINCCFSRNIRGATWHINIEIFSLNMEQFKYTTNNHSHSETSTLLINKTWNWESMFGKKFNF